MRDQPRSSTDDGACRRYETLLASAEAERDRIPLVAHDRALGTLDIASRCESAFTDDDARLLTHVAEQIAIAVENALAYREIAALKNKLASEKVYLEEEIKTEYNFEKIIGRGAASKLGLNRSTLRSKMIKLDINRPS